MKDLVQDLHDRLAAHLHDKGFRAKPDHTANGEQIVQFGNTTGLMLFVEIYDQETGDHKRVPLYDLAQELTKN